MWLLQCLNWLWSCQIRSGTPAFFPPPVNPCPPSCPIASTARSANQPLYPSGQLGVDVKDAEKAIGTSLCLLEVPVKIAQPTCSARDRSLFAHRHCGVQQPCELQEGQVMWWDICLTLASTTLRKHSCKACTACKDYNFIYPSPSCIPSSDMP